jgi:AcrR family transcriptional regulator
MRSAPDDRRTDAVIRDSAMALFAARGVEPVTIRQIAHEAGVSPGLVMHHYGSKAGLKAAVDRHVSHLVEALVGELGHDGDGSFAAALAERLDRQPDLVAYVGRMLVEPGAGGDELFSRLFHVTLDSYAALRRSGAVRPSDDELAVAAFLLVNDLAVVLLRDRLAALVGIDPFHGDGLVRWANVAIDVYENGLFT